MRSRMRARGLATAGLAAMLLIGPALAVHAGPSGDVVGNGHYWPFKKTPVTITFGDNLDSKWEGYFDDSLRRWNKSDVIKGKSTRGSTNGTDCAPKDGTVQVCNAAYGQNKGWLGLTQIRFNKSKITSVTVQFNDSFFSSGSKYNDPRAKQHTACHEMGHAIGLFHPERPAIVPGETLPLAEGMVITLEPGVYLPGVGGLRLEQNYVVRDGPPEPLSRFPLELIEVGA